MLRGIWARCALVVVTISMALPVVLLVTPFPRFGNLSMRFGRLWSRAMLAVVGARVTYQGLEHIPLGRPCIFMANHQSIVDIWALIRILPLSTRFVAKQELFRIPVFGWVLATAGFVSIDRSNRMEAIRSLELAAKRIRSGLSLVMFPEGTRTRDGRLRPFKKGAFHLALRAGVPVVPVAITGSFEIMPPGTLSVRPGTVRVFFEPAVDVAGFQPDDYKGLLQAVAATIERRVHPPAFEREADAAQLEMP